MKKFYLTLLITAFTLVVQAQQPRILKGRVLDELGLSLPGATVMFVEYPEKGTITNVDGNFIITDLPEGDLTLRISYIGYATFEEKIGAFSGVSSTRSYRLQPGVKIAGEVIILGDRLKGQAKALNQQKNNTNITNVVAADQIGRFPDANIGDAMKRITGVTMQYDQGEARDIIIRGMAPQLNSVMINGERIPSAEGDNRRIQMDLIPSDMVQAIEVNKAVTPDMDADAIGGSVNLVTRKAPSGLRISGTAASGMNFLSNKPIWTGSAIIGNRFANDKLGVIFSTSYNNHNFGSDNVEAVWVENDNANEAILEEFDVRKYLVQRVRRSASLSMDYAISPKSTLFLTSMYNWRDDWENRYRFRVSRIEDAFDDGDVTSLGNGRYEILGRTSFQTKGGIDSDRVKNTRLEDQRVANVTLGGEHLLGSKIKFTWSGTYARASEARPNERYIDYRSGGQSLIMDINNPERPNVFFQNPSDASAIGLNSIWEENQDVWEEDFNSRFDFTAPVNDRGVLKFGGRLRNKEKVRDLSYIEYEPVDEDAFGATNGSVPNSDQSDRDYLAGSQYQIGNFTTASFLGGLNLYNPSLFDATDLPEEYAASEYNATERITGGYTMLDYQLSKKLSMLAGLRLEHTSIDYTGNSYNIDNEVVVAQTGSDAYLNVLPGLHLKYDASENTIIRAAWTNTLARPNYFDLVPYKAFSRDDEEVEQGNHLLTPATSSNLDLMMENYFESIGIVSGGVFYKKINDFIYTRRLENFNDPDLGLVQFSQPQNGGSANVFGFELSFQRQLDFLPGFWKGFGVYLNYTYTESETTGVTEREAETLSLPGTAGNMFNASLSYETEKLVLRASLNATSDYLDEFGGNAFEDRYYDKQLFLDFNGSYAFTNKLRFFAELNNITNQPLRFYQGISSRTMQMEYYNMRMNLGLKFDLFE